MIPDHMRRAATFTLLPHVRLALCCLLLALAPCAAMAQNVTSTSVLLNLTVTDTPQGGTNLTLTFAGPAPPYSVVKNDSDKTVVAFAQSARGSSATFASRASGLLRAVDFEQNGSSLFLDFTSSPAARIIVTPGADRTITLSFTPTTPVQLTPPSAAPPPGPTTLPKEAERAPGQDDFEVVLLRYADVSEVVGLLTEGLSVKSNDTFTPQEPNFGSAGGGTSTPGGFAGPGGQYGATQMANANANANAPLGESVDDTIAVDRRLNAIILKGSPERIARLKAKIAEIDVPVQSVLLETMFVELDQTGAKNVGLDFTNSNSQIAVATFQTGGFVGAGATSGRTLSSVALQAAVYAQVQAGHGKIVSKPRIAAQSGSTAKIITGDAIPILTSIALSGVNAVSQQVQYVNVGVTLQIAPRVSSDGFVTSHIFCVVSSVSGASQGYPTISQREAETSATVRDGETFVIGGLTQDSDIVSNTKVPVFGDVPGLGDLFKLKTGNQSKTELYIVVTPHLTHPGSEPPPPPAE